MYDRTETYSPIFLNVKRRGRDFNSHCQGEEGPREEGAEEEAQSVRLGVLQRVSIVLLSVSRKDTHIFLFFDQ